MRPTRCRSAPRPSSTAAFSPESRRRRSGSSSRLIVADPQVKVTTLEIRGPSSLAPPLTPAILDPIKKLAAQFWPGVPVVPILQSGATDGQFLNAAGIPTYGFNASFSGPDLGHVHGLNEYIGVDSLMQDREFMYRLVKIYAEQP